MQAHLSFNHINDFVTWVGMKLGTVLASSSDKSYGLGLLPLDTHRLAALGELPILIGQVND